MKPNLLPLAGVLVSLTLFAWAAAIYPGGYDWSRDFISDLFVPTTAAGEINSARYVAALAMFFLCLSVAVIFKMVSARATAQAHQKTLEIGGIGAAVYAFLVVTPMHDLLVGIALLFFLPAMVAALYLVRVQRRMAVFWAGLACLGLLVIAATMYYGNLFWHLLPLAQKVSMSACVGWLLVLQLATERRAGADGSAAQRDAPSGTD